MPDRPVTASLIVIGNEILSGRTQDKNVAYLGEWLGKEGIRLLEVRVIPDVEQTIADTVNELRRRFDYVFTTGGIGPTHDDITSESVAAAFGLPHGEHPEARAILDAHYGPEQLNEARLRMAKTPEGAILIENPVSKAPGFQVENVLVLAGIPAIMQAMLESLRHRLTGGAPILSCSLTASVQEGRVAADLGALQQRYPDIDIGSYPFNRDGRFATRLVLRGTDRQQLAAASDELEGIVAKLGGEGTWDSE